MDERLESIKLGLPLQFVAKEKKIMDALGQMAGKLPAATVLKGGTALHFAYLHKRFSEDIDFDFYIKQPDPPRSGFEVEGPWRFRSIKRFHLKYQFMDKPDIVRLEFAKKSREKWKIARRFVTHEPLRSFTGSVVAGIPLYSLEFLLAQKIHLLYERAEGKDAFDLYVGLSLQTPSKKSIKAVAELEGILPKTLVNRAISALEKSSPKALKQTNAYIPRSFRPRSWRQIITGLLDELNRLSDSLR